MRSKCFIREHGVGTSIMDYQRFNYLAQPEDGLEPQDLLPRIGIYDEMCIRDSVYIEALPSEQKKVILMSIEGYSWDEIAEKLGISVNTVKTHKSRGFKSLRSKLQDSVCLFLI